jgi:hypothetical protein
LAAALLKRSFRRFIHSKGALALPVTFLILLVSTLSIISVTYAFSVERINSQGQSLKVSTAKQSILSLDDALLSTLCQPGSSKTFDLADSGGKTNIQPDGNVLTLSIQNNIDIPETIFNSSVGKIIYELPSSQSSQIGFYLKGDSRTITNQSGSSTSQMCIQTGAEHPEIQLRYRPTITYSVAGLENGKVVNNIRIYIVNLNSSDSIALFGELPLQISCTNTQLISKNYELSSESGPLVITSVLDGVTGRVSLPFSSTPQGVIINIEIVISNVSIQRWIR